MASLTSAQGLNDIPWMNNVEQAKRLALQQNKMVLLHFGASWCRPCRALDTYVFNSAIVKRAIAENVIPVKLDADTALDMVNEYNVSSVPFDVMITPSGRIVSERKSPAESDNYAKMISGVAFASRKLEEEKHGPIAHQQDLAKNPLANPNSADFRASGPQVDAFELPKDGRQMQRRQNAALVGGGRNSVRKKNPWVNSAASNETSHATSHDKSLASSMRDEAVSVDDLQRNAFLNREREWVAPSQKTRRAKPARIVNDRYFETLKKKESTNRVQSLGDVELVAGSRDDVGISSGVGDFDPEVNLPIGKVVDVSVESPDLLDLEPVAPKIVTETFCLSGKCPVTLLSEGRWADGDPEFGIVHRKRTYIFASAEKLALFRSNPDKYSPILAGYDPVVYHDEGKLVEGIVENGVFMGKTPEQKVILFSNDETRAKFQSQPKMYLETIRIATMNARKNRIR